MTTVGVLMAGLDSRIVIVGLPSVAASLGADAEQAIWITQAYVLGSTVALLLVGRISDIVGRVKLYTSGFAVFTLGSLLTSLATNPAQVIGFRALQGLGSAILFTNSAAMIVDATPSHELGLSLGINQVAFRMGSMAGLTVSGVILSRKTMPSQWSVSCRMHRAARSVTSSSNLSPFRSCARAMTRISRLTT